MKTYRNEKLINGHVDVELAADLYLEPEVTFDNQDAPVLELAVSRERTTGTLEITRLKIRIPRSSITRILHSIRKLHERERAQIDEDLAALKVAP